MFLPPSLWSQAGTTTLGVGSSSLEDCGCKSGSINLAEAGGSFDQLGKQASKQGRKQGKQQGV